MRELVRLFFEWYLHHQVPGLFLFLLVEETGVPLLIPGDTLIIAAGARDRSWPAALTIIGVSALASAMGSSILYYLMRRGGRSLLLKYGKYLHLHPERVDYLERKFQAHGALAIVVGRLVPGFRTPTTVMAGIFEVPYRTFVPATAFAAVIWAATYFYLGVALERAYRRFAGILLRNERAVVAVAVAFVLVAVLVWLLSRQSRRPVASAE
ncbi:MAG TPA: DedA family protein [Chloroflexota bacterium]|nr:DedA family protein [Chloroflexota bacterium]